METETIVQGGGSPFMPQQIMIIESPVSAMGGGPYYAYNPGPNIFGFRDSSRGKFNEIWGGKIKKIEGYEVWSRAEWLPEGAGIHKRQLVSAVDGRVLDKHLSFIIPAEQTLALVTQGYLPTKRGVSSKGMEFLSGIDLNEELFNKLLVPLTIPERWPNAAYSADIPTDQVKEYTDIIKTQGYIAVKKRWAQEAIEKLTGQRPLQGVFQAYFDKNPDMSGLWHRAIVEGVLPILGGWEVKGKQVILTAESDSAKETRKGYDDSDRIIMWDLGIPEQQDVINQTLAAVAKGNGGMFANEDQFNRFVNALRPQDNSAAMSGGKFQCGGCGEWLNMVNGGFPKKCRFCGDAFVDQEPVPIPYEQPAITADAEKKEAIIIERPVSEPTSVGSNASVRLSATGDTLVGEDGEEWMVSDEDAHVVEAVHAPIPDEIRAIAESIKAGSKKKK